MNKIRFLIVEPKDPKSNLTSKNKCSQNFHLERIKLTKIYYLFYC